MRPRTAARSRAEAVGARRGWRYAHIVAGRDPFPEVDQEWSRPKQVSVLLKRVGLDVPVRLSTKRFHTLLSNLRGFGLEVGTSEHKRVANNARSPGIDAKLRLRRSASGDGSSLAEDRPSVPADSEEASIRRFRLGNFKSFDEGTLPLSELTLLIGANASGKSNLLEALHLLSWMASGQPLGYLRLGVNEGDLRIRGTAADLHRNADSPIRLGCDLAPNARGRTLELSLSTAKRREGLRVVNESLVCPQAKGSMPMYRVARDAGEHGRELTVEYNNFAKGKNKPQINCVDEQPVFTQLTTPARFRASHKTSQQEIPIAARRVRDALADILFLDPQPAAMRGYAYKEQARLSPDGGSLSGVLFGLAERGEKKRILQFVRDLPEQNVTDIGFASGAHGDVMLKLQETFGGEKAWHVAAVLSDGTLRVLAIAAALLSAPPGALVVIEEIDNGVHPSRAGKLLDRIRELSIERGLGILLTTHNPALLDELPDAAIPHVVFCFRHPETGASRLVKLGDTEQYAELVASGPLGRLVTRGVLDRMVKREQTSTAKERRAAAKRELDAILGG